MRAIRMTDGASSRYGNVSMRAHPGLDGDGLIARLLDSLVNDGVLMVYSLPLTNNTVRLVIPHSSHDKEFSRARSAMLCHPERSEGSSSMGREMLRCAQ